MSTKAHCSTTHRRKRRAADEASVPAERAEAPARSLETLRQLRAGSAERGRAALRLQQVVGNAGVGRVLAQRAGAPASRDLKDVEVANAVERPGMQNHHAGTPARQDPPGGLNAIGQHGDGGLGAIGGWTGIFNAAAFTAPSFTTNNTYIRTNDNKVEHFAEVQPTTSQDATHSSYYPGPGDHLREFPNGATQKIDGRTYTHYARMSDQISALIRAGEQEHLDDALRAYQITYQLVASKVNELAGRRFGPADTPEHAENLARDELKQKIPAALGGHPSGWATMLDQLLKATKQRDTRGLHDITFGSSRRAGKKIIWPVETTSTTKIGAVLSDQIVNYPSP